MHFKFAVNNEIKKNKHSQKYFNCSAPTKIKMNCDCIEEAQTIERNQPITNKNSYFPPIRFDKFRHFLQDFLLSHLDFQSDFLIFSLRVFISMTILSLLQNCQICKGFSEIFLAFSSTFPVLDRQ